MARWSRTAAVACVLLLGVVSAAVAQRGFGGFGRLPEGPGVPPRFPPKTFPNGDFYVCKMMYRSVWSEPMGAGWSTDYPYAGINLMTRIAELTKTPVSLDEKGYPNYWVVRLTDDALFRCPFLIGSDVGTAEFSAVEAKRLRDYLLKGGFLWVDDFWGPHAWQVWSTEIHKALPEYSIVDIPADHPIRHEMFDVVTLPQVTNIQFWRRSGGRSTQERGPEDSPYADFRMIADEKGRIMVLMTHNTDIGDSWEREAEDHEFFLQFSPAGYSVGVNVVLYALSH
jgi:uncharacterized protein DUF4159